MTWLQTGSGREIDLNNPRPEDVDFADDIPEALARIARFTGHAGGYSVAQHCVLGADAIFRDTGDRSAAAAFLLHDAHEAYLGDIATPIMQAIAEACADAVAAFEIDPGFFRGAMRELKKKHDRAIFTAAYGPPDASVWPSAACLALVRRTDLALMNAERRLFLGPSPKPWALEVEAVPPLDLSGIAVWLDTSSFDTWEATRGWGPETLWPARAAAEAYRNRLARYLPERFCPAAPRPNPEPRPSGAALEVA